MEEHEKINLAAFDEIEKRLMRRYNYKYALVHNGELVDVYNDLEDAHKIARKFCPDDKFLVKQIKAPTVRVGPYDVPITAVDD